MVIQVWMIPFLVLLFSIIIFFATNRRYRWIYIISKTFRRDIRGIKLLYVLNRCMKKCTREKLTVWQIFSAIAEKNPKKVAFYFEDEAWTYKKVEELCNQVANYFLANNYCRGDNIALILDNSAEYPCIWLGLSKIGVVTALINTNQIKESLVHSVKVTECKAIIFGSNFTDSIRNVSKSLSSLKLFQLNEIENNGNGLLDGAIDLRKGLTWTSSQFSSQDIAKGSHDDAAIYIFTSGTTGLPKAARVTHLRCLLMTTACKQMAGVEFKDIFYTPLPLYHTAGGIMGVGQALFFGTTVAIRKKFSATQYFEDCAKYNATVAQYVGELCRYLLSAPESIQVKHNVRTLFGNGLRPQLWKPLFNRFKIKNIVEIYGATEGISNMGNLDNKEGAVGFIPFYLRNIYPATVIKCDEDTGEEIRNRDGYCIACGPGEPGMLVGKIDPNNVAFKYDGYTDNKSSEKKIVKNVFRDGDMYFNSGDILEFDELGYFYFKDRTGDTFRWKGENVSTTEVESVISGIVQLNDVVVYGVKIPESDGRAGMAAIVDTSNTFDIEKLAESFQNNLPSYAIPIFVRVLDAVPVTGTFKLRKTDLRTEGYNIQIIKDPVYFLDPKFKKYVLLKNNLYQELINGNLKL